MMQRWGIRNRVTLVAVLPAVVLALILTAFFTRSRIADIEDAYTERARAFARQLAASAEYPLFSGDRVSLQRLAESSLIQSDILGVAVLDPEGSPLALAGSMHDASISLAIASRPVRREGQLLRLQEAVLPSRVELGGALEGPELVAQQAGPAALGYVVLDISRERLTARRNSIRSSRPSWMRSKTAFAAAACLPRAAALGAGRGASGRGPALDPPALGSVAGACF
jgi:hypothetical protein